MTSIILNMVEHLILTTTIPSSRTNDRLWNWIRRQDKESLTKYYSTLDYIKNRGRNSMPAFNQMGNLGRLGNQMFFNMLQCEVSLLQCVDMNSVFLSIQDV